MTDGQGPISLKPEDGTENSVASLASRAIAVLASKRAQSRPVLSEKLILDLVDAARGHDDAVRAALQSLAHEGIPAEEVADFYIPEAARRLGDDWCSDGMGFAEVTIGSARLQRALRSVTSAPRHSTGATEPAGSVLVVVMEEHFHTLGAMVVTEQLRRNGLSVRLLLGEANRRVLQTVATGHFDAIFFSVAVVEKFADLRDLVEKVRDVSPRPTPTVVGGAVGHLGADVRKVTGADHTATDPKEALRLCGLKISAPDANRQRETSG